MTRDSVGRNLAWHRPFVYYVTRDICVMWKRASSSVEKKWERKDYRIARARAQPPNTASYGSRRTRSLQTLRHTHPAGLLFQSNLLVDAGRTSQHSFLRHNSPLASTYHAERSKSAKLIDCVVVVVVFLLHVGQIAPSQNFEIVEKENRSLFSIMAFQVGFNSVLSGFIQQDLLNV